MAGNLGNKYGASNQPITVTLASLANNGARASTAIDNTGALGTGTPAGNFPDALVSGHVKTNAAGTSGTGIVNIYAYGTTDGGTNYTEAATGTDAGITLTSPPNAQKIGSFNANANGVTYNFGPFSVAAAFGGVLPDHWGLIFENKTGAALDATAGNHLVTYQGVAGQYS